MFAVFHEQRFQPVEQIALGAKMAEITTLRISLLGLLLHFQPLLGLLLHFQPVVAMETVPFDEGGINSIPPEDMFHRDPNR